MRPLLCLSVFWGLGLPVFATMCGRMPSPCEALAEADVVFRGRPRGWLPYVSFGILQGTLPHGGPATLFHASEVFKGPPGTKRFWISIPVQPLFGLLWHSFDQESEYLIYGYKQGLSSRLYAHDCTRTRRTSREDWELAELRAAVRGELRNVIYGYVSVSRFDVMNLNMMPTEPLAAAKVELRNSIGRPVGAMWTGRDGRFRFKQVREGVHWLVATSSQGNLKAKARLTMSDGACVQEPLVVR